MHNPNGVAPRANMHSLGGSTTQRGSSGGIPPGVNRRPLGRVGGGACINRELLSICG